MTNKKHLYPLKFDTIFKDKIWGGSKIRDVLGKDFSPLKNCGETWEISGVKGNLSTVSEGCLKGLTLPEITAIFKEDFVGQKCIERYGDEFPLLIKFIDAAQDLSIQVHPDDKLAMERHNSSGKTEMWYIVDAEKDAQLISGFGHDTSKAEYLESITNGKLKDLLNFEVVETGDSFYMPSGRIHSIGKGLLVAEIEQSSDVTYRIYDFDRVDSEGKKRELHTEAAIDAIDFKAYDNYKNEADNRQNKVTCLATSKYFEVNLLNFSNEIIRKHHDKESFIIYVCVEGEAEITTLKHSTKIKKGNAVLIPKKFPEIHIRTNSSFKLLETYLP